MAVNDKITILGLVNAKTMGLLLFSSFYLFALLRQILAQKNLLQFFWEGLIVINAAFFLFQTQSHDRYAFPLSVFLLLWPRISKFSSFYILFSVFYFYNLHTALVVNYPTNGIPLLTGLIQPFFTITTAIILLSLFAGFIFYLSRQNFLIFLILFVIWILSFVVLNWPLIARRPVSLTRFSPILQQQDWGTLGRNKSVDANRLSVQYAFYKSGLGTHANSRYVFDINKKFKRFTFDYGIDTDAGTQASAVFRVLGDGKNLWQSEKIGRFDLPRHAEINITGVKHLELVTVDAGNGIADDHTDWLNPMLIP